MTLIVIIGFILFELGWYIAHPLSKTLTMWFHHIGAVLAITIPLYYGDSGAECVVATFVAEITTPVLILRSSWFLLHAKCHLMIVLSLEYIFLVAYFYCRVIISTQFLIALVSHNNTRFGVELFVFLLWVNGLIFLWRFAKRTIKRTRNAMNGLKNKFPFVDAKLT